MGGSIRWGKLLLPSRPKADPTSVRRRLQDQSRASKLGGNHFDLIELEPPTPMENHLGCGHVKINVDREQFEKRMEYVRPPRQGKARSDKNTNPTSASTMTATGSHNDTHKSKASFDGPSKRGRRGLKIRHGRLHRFVYRSIPRVGQQTCLLSQGSCDPKSRRVFHQRRRSHNKRALKDMATTIVMKIIWGSRVARFGILHPFRLLARSLSCWNAACGERLHRLICHLHQKLLPPIRDRRFSG